MRKAITGALLGLFLFVNSGCVVALGNKGPLQTTNRQAVAIEGEVYIVNLQDETVRKLDRETLTSAQIIGNDEE